MISAYKIWAWSPSIGQTVMLSNYELNRRLIKDNHEYMIELSGKLIAERNQQQLMGAEDWQPIVETYQTAE
jgi:ABC-type cobalamin transport system ATPase subunit